MKTFFIALLLGILIGCLATVYHYDPETFDNLIPEKSSLSDETTSKKIEEKTEEIVKETQKATEKVAEDLKENSESWTDTIKEKGSEALGNTRDLTIGTTIRGKLKLDSEIDSSAISIDVEDGHVTLSGNVASKEIKQRVISLAIETKWVKEVESELEIQ